MLAQNILEEDLSSPITRGCVKGWIKLFAMIIGDFSFPMLMVKPC